MCIRDSYYSTAAQLEANLNDEYPNVLPSFGQWTYGIFGEDKGTDNQIEVNLSLIHIYFFISQSSCSREGELFFGGNKGYNSFFPAALEKDNEAVPYLITDIKIFNRSFAVLEPEVRERISSVMPSFTRKLDPVSYTHLDVYKRQVPPGHFPIQETRIVSCRLLPFFPPLHRGISHTARRFRTSRNVRL